MWLYSDGAAMLHRAWAAGYLIWWSDHRFIKIGFYGSGEIGTGELFNINLNPHRSFTPAAPAPPKCDNTCIADASLSLSEGAVRRQAPSPTLSCKCFLFHHLIKGIYREQKIILKRSSVISCEKSCKKEIRTCHRNVLWRILFRGNRCPA